MKKPWLAAVLSLVPLGLGYLYLGRVTMFAYVFFLGVASPLVGFLLGSVIVDGVLATVVDDCVGPFSKDCPRPGWAYVPIGLGWVTPPLLVGALTAWYARAGAMARNAALVQPEHQGAHVEEGRAPV